MWKYVVLIFLQSTEETAEENGLQILKRKNNRHKGVTCFIEQLGDAMISWSSELGDGRWQQCCKHICCSPRRVTLQTLPREWKSGWQSDCAGFNNRAASQSLLWPRLTMWCELVNSPRNVPALLGCWVQLCVSSKQGCHCLPCPSVSMQLTLKGNQSSLTLHWAPLEGEGCSSARVSCGMGWQRSAVRSGAEQ